MIDMENMFELMEKRPSEFLAAALRPFIQYYDIAQSAELSMSCQPKFR